MTTSFLLLGKYKWLAFPVFGLIVLITLFSVDYFRPSMERLVLKEAKKCGLHKISLRELPQEVFATSQVFKVSGFLKGTGTLGVCTVAMTAPGRTYRLPDGFNAVIETESYEVGTETAALEIARAYVSLIRPHGEIIILDSASEIPYQPVDGVGYPENWKDPRELGFLIAPPQVSKIETGYRVNMFVWRELGGLIEKWEISVSPKGFVSATNEILADRVGNTVSFL